MKVLALDTSNNTLGIALLDDTKVVGEYVTNLKKNHSVRLMPAIEQLLQDCGLQPADLEKIVVAKGPGSYTGVRIGVTVAKTLAWSLNIPLVGISSLEILAAQVGPYFTGVISPIFDARRGLAYTGLYQFKEGTCVQLEEDCNVLVKEWALQLKQLDQPVLFVGEDTSIHDETLKETLGAKAIFASTYENNPRPSVLAYLGKDKPGEDIHRFAPNYIRMVEAEAKWLEAQSKN